MAELLLELFSEEIPARMQVRAAEDLARLVAEALAPLTPTNPRPFSGPRRIALAVELAAAVPAQSISERGPRRTAPEQALAGFLRKHGASKDDLREEGDFWVLEKRAETVEAATLIAQAIPAVLRRFPWPKSMRWGGTSNFTWVRPLRRILCIFDGRTVHFDLRDGADDGHGLVSSNVTEGHRFLAPAHFEVVSAQDWQDKLRAAHVLTDAAERRALIAEGITALATSRGLTVVDDPGLLDEVAGLVEWPVCLLGAIDAVYMDLPAEVRQVTMRVNQRYFALRNAANFAFVANIIAPDAGATIVAGNERVLRARLADARHFLELDRRQTLESRVPALDSVTYHAKLGSQGDRVRRLVHLAEIIAPHVKADVSLAMRAAKLAKADLTSGMVGEFPELQGVMGDYYARREGESFQVSDAVRDHYAPKGPGDSVPSAPVSIAVALTDKLDQLAGFFSVEEKPTGSGDPYALRRAALGVIRLIRDNKLPMDLAPLLDAALNEFDQESVNRQAQQHRVFTQGLDPTTGKPIPGLTVFSPPISFEPKRLDIPTLRSELLTFLAERLRVQLRSEGARYDVLNAVLGIGMDGNITRLLARTDAVASMLATDDGTNLLAAFRRAANILRIEEKKDGPHDTLVDPTRLAAPEERALADALGRVEPIVGAQIANENFTAAMASLSHLRAPLDAFFERVTVNDPEAELRRNRLALLARVRAAMNLAADFSRIEG